MVCSLRDRGEMRDDCGAGDLKGGGGEGSVSHAPCYILTGDVVYPDAHQDEPVRRMFALLYHTFMDPLKSCQGCHAVNGREPIQVRQSRSQTTYSRSPSHNVDPHVLVSLRIPTKQQAHPFPLSRAESDHTGSFVVNYRF